MTINQILQTELKIQGWQVEQTIALIDEGNTIPFIARYRKEMTGSLSDDILRDFYERLTYLRNLEARKETVISKIEEQGKLTEALKKKILSAKTMVEVEDLYLPYKQKRRTRATIAKEKGLEPFAILIMMQEVEQPLIELAKVYIDAEKNVENEGEAIEGAKDILAEMISEEATYRKEIRGLTFESGTIIAKAKNDALKSVFEMYYDYHEQVKNIVGHRVLAINRGEKEKVLVVKLEAPTNEIEKYLRRQIIIKNNPYTTEVLKAVIEDAYKRLIGPAIEREIRNQLTEMAEESSIRVFGKNLEQLLLQAPISGAVVLALDPAFRTGCKTAVIDGTGKVLDTAVIYPTPPKSEIEKSKQVLKPMIKKYGVTVVAIGNGTASRETENFAVEMIKELDKPIPYVVVNEAGASVYSASKLGAMEFPQFDVALRSAVSIGRRLQDPLAELVKIDPKSIGVGQYQHDMNQKKLGEALSGVVEDCVNKVGVDLNTASPSLLSYVSGISDVISKNIVTYREVNGRFKKRVELKKVPKLGPKAYEQCAGFLRIPGGKDPLDNTGVHPESYEVAHQLLTEIGITIEDVKKGNAKIKISQTKTMAEKLGVGEPTLIDMVKELEKPGRDPRDDMPKPVLRSDVLEMTDLKEGMILKGTVRNVIDFGAFVDIGVHQDGLVHISQLCDRYIKHPLEVVSVGDIVEVKILSVDIEKKRIGLTMKL